MNFEITQSLQRKLVRRVERLRNVDGRFLPAAMKQFFSFLSDEPVLRGLLTDIELKITLDPDTREFHGWEDLTKIKSEAELIKILLINLKNLANNNYGLSTDSIAGNFGFHSPNDLNKARDFIFVELIKPFCDYFTEHLDSQKDILSFILRYKRRREWFHQNRLRKIVEVEQEKKQTGQKKYASVEDELALDLYSYLFDEGINFYISPSSITGRIDLIEEEKRPLLEGQESSSHRLLADAKVFDGKNRDCGYIGKGFGQILRYCKKYNEPFGYLIIFNISDGELDFEIENMTNENWIYQKYGKSIVFVVIDLNKSKGDSTLGKAKGFVIKEKHLLVDKESNSEKQESLQNSAEII